ENESNTERLWGVPNRTPFVKDSINDMVVSGAEGRVNPLQTGTKMAAHYSVVLQPGETETILLRLSTTRQKAPFAKAEQTFKTRQLEADAFYDGLPASHFEDLGLVQRQALAGLLWSKQLYYYDVTKWARGDPAGPPPPEGRRRNNGWKHLSN